MYNNLKYELDGERASSLTGENYDLVFVYFPVLLTCGKQTPQSVRLYSRYVYSVPGGTGVAPPKSCAPSSNLSLQLIQSSITCALDFSVHLYIRITYPRFILKFVPRDHFHRLLPTAPAQCLLVVVVGVVGMKIGYSSSSPLVNLLFLRSLGCFLASIQTMGSVLAGSFRRLLAPIRLHNS